ncbi:hypothetical protein ACQR3W_22165 [Rhodococcus ruber]|nr:hypothetical protein [Rhodococcus ruber]MCZ4533534.1 hypothetical protein [Rhodococcus ruber]
MISPLRYLWTRYKLSKGRCAYCDAILRDDERSGFCDDDCAQEYLHATAY